MKHIVPLILFVILLAACGPDRAQTIDPPAPTDEPTPAVEVTAAEPTAQLPTPTDEPQPTDEPTAAPATPTTEPEPTAEPAGDTADVDQEALLAALLTLDDMPTGWTGTAPTVELRTPGGTYPSFCAAELPARSIAAAAVDFEKSALGPLFSQTIVLYPDGDSAEAAFDDLLEAARNCPEMTDSAGNTNTFSPLSFPAIGDETFAMRSSGLVELDIINIRVDDALITIMHGGLGAVDSTQTETFARAAVARYGR